MDKRKRSTKLYELGQEAYDQHRRDDGELGAAPVLYAMAVMLDAAVNPKKEKAPTEKPALRAADVFERFKTDAPQFVTYAPQDPAWFSTLQRNIGKVQWPPETLDKLIEWATTGRGTMFFKNKPASFQVVAKNFKAWANEALAGDIIPARARPGEVNIVRPNGPRGR